MRLPTLAACILAAALVAARQPATEEPTTQPADLPTTEPSEQPSDSPTTQPAEESTDSPATEPTENTTDSPTTSPSEEPEPDATPTADSSSTTEASAATPPPAEPPGAEPPPEREVGEFDATERYILPFKLTLDGWQLAADSKNDRFVRILLQPTTTKKEELGVEMAALIIGAQRLQPGDVSTRKEFTVFEEGYIAGRKTKSPDLAFAETEDASDLSDIPTRRGVLTYGVEDGGDPKYKSYHVLVMTKNNAIVIAMDGDAAKGDEIKAELDRLLESFEWTTPAEELKDQEK